jgi:hypothetical protein
MSKKVELKDETANGTKPVLYAVLKLSTEIEYTNPFTQEQVTCKLGGFAGYIPVFSNIEEAEKSAQDGKYQIIAIQA